MVKKRVAIYTRVSTVEQAREGYSLAAQEKVLRNYCELKKLDVTGVYPDEGISGKNIKGRPGFMALLRDAKENKFDIVLVWKLSRFTRNLKDLVNTCEELEASGIMLESFSENFDSDTAAGRLMRGVLGVMGQFEREVLSENVRLGLEERALRGMRTCTQILGYDIVKGGDMTVNKKEAEVVRFIFHKYIERKRIMEVARLCNEKGFTGKRGRAFSPSSVLIVLTRFVYCGYYSWKEKPIKGNFEPIIDVGTYNRVQHLIKAEGKLNGRKRKTKIVFLDT